VIEEITKMGKNCRFVFKALLDLARKYNIRINFLYGEAGHGRGLIDAMAWFGAKGPMRKQIIATDEWFSNASQMVVFLTNLFKDVDNKEYHFLDQDATAAIRKACRAEKKIPGCMSSHVIFFFADGETYKKWKTVKDFMDDANTHNNEQHNTLHELEEETVEEEEELPMWHETMNEMDMYSMIEIDSFVTIHSERGELFHLMKVEKKEIAKKSFMDSSGNHTVLEGEPYLVCKWYSFQKESKKFAWFSPQSESTEKSVIHMGEVFSTDLSLNEANQMDITEYRMLICNAT
jgi:hypothetical protein